MNRSFKEIELERKTREPRFGIVSFAAKQAVRGAVRCERLVPGARPARCGREPRAADRLPQPALRGRRPAASLQWDTDMKSNYNLTMLLKLNWPFFKDFVGSICKIAKLFERISETLWIIHQFPGIILTFPQFRQNYLERTS